MDSLSPLIITVTTALLVAVVVALALIAHRSHQRWTREVEADERCRAAVHAAMRAILATWRAQLDQTQRIPVITVPDRSRR